MISIKYLIIILAVISFCVWPSNYKSTYITRVNAASYDVEIQVKASEIYGMYKIDVKIGSIPTKFHCLKLHKVDLGIYGDKGPNAITPLNLNSDGDLYYSFYLKKDILVRTSIGINYSNTLSESQCEQLSLNAFIVELSAWKTSNSDVLQLDEE
ncbi:hypothetical protein H5123_01675 [Shewanella sp. SR43-4]|uniref:hypothetical protein n=1 Tax=Shewanella sp. SR43-4 TaxID=2760942 RepID=UPI0015F8244A|nr:hypothetical protein [Shewanella sp. SR43-4]MBB1316357.1 hypothetical protein [Shewanella sp. SR43-4]